MGGLSEKDPTESKREAEDLKWLMVDLEEAQNSTKLILASHEITNN